ncbi:MAG: TOBE-like domain-containing protein, partial [Kiritimatiellae bacterium]|nr:TOBE-like domain-containing protein [Kiritimatiellia bacterium]
EGVLDAGGVRFAAHGHADTRDAQGVGYVRPHDLEIDREAPGEQGSAVQLRRAHAIGPLAQLELARFDNGQLIEAVIANERYQQLQLKEGETLTVRPKRLHVFIDEPV